MAIVKREKAPLRVFVSSTYDDMKDYRQAVIDELNNLEVIPRAMEQFVSSPDKPLDVVLAEVRRCQLFIALVAMRYGSIDMETGKSFSELEYEEAVKNGIPVLAFIIDENECPVLPRYVDVGEAAEKLKKFKDTLNKKYASRFKSVDDLKQLVVRAVKRQIEQDSNENKVAITTATNNDYKAGAEIFKRFLILPGRYKNRSAFLRVRVSSKYSTWIVKDELFSAFNLNHDDAIHCNDGAHIIGIDLSDVQKEGVRLDLFAEGKNADWLLDNGVTLGTIFEGTFKLCYENVKGISSGDRVIGMAAVVLLSGSSIIGKDNEFLAKISASEGEDEDESESEDEGVDPMLLAHLLAGMQK
ncbi:MAG: DUF4062 domain-containing protein [Oscillospiraceae bacterium]|jgi:hypothetical protein|nr:DUF4062 domain-containing protein [Oscillospiraceae bacterium]